MARGPRLQGKVVLISGAARGLGASMAGLFCSHGAAVMATDISDEEGERVVAAIRAEGGNAVYEHLDVTSEDDWARAIARCNEELGTVSVLVSNAFKFGGPMVHEMTTETWRSGLEVNLTGPFFGIRAVLPTMLANGGGTIVAISASAGGDAALPPTKADFEAAKAGTTALVRNVAASYGRQGIRANAVHPGPIRTPILEEIGIVPIVEEIARGFPLGRIGEPEEVAQVALFLASDESSYITGSKIIVDGGSLATITPVQAAG
jgi:3alpha(or 20beta)-hydroxysteroid dehydrogenase